MKSIVYVGTCMALLSLSLTGCLTSRLQVREDEDRPVAAKGSVEPVQPQGSYVLDEIKGELTRMNGRIEELERSRQDPNASNTAKEEMRKLETRIITLEQNQNQLIEALRKMQEARAAAPSATYEQGKALFDGRQYDAAIQVLTDYLKDPAAIRSEDATYLRGEAYFIQKQWKKAIVDFSRFPEKFVRSKHMPSALFKIGASFEAMGMKDDAKGFYQELVEKFPKTAEAKKARTKVK